MSKPTKPPVDHPIDDKQVMISNSKSIDESMHSAEESSDQITKPNLEDIRTAGF